MWLPMEAQFDWGKAGVEPQPIVMRVVETEDAVRSSHLLAFAHDHRAGQHSERVHVLHEFGDIVIGGAQDDVLCSAGLHDAAMVHDRNSIAEPQRLVEIMAY